MNINTSIPSALADQALYNSQEETQETQPMKVTMQEPITTPIFDFTATINAALAQAIAQAVAPLVERIQTLELHLINRDPVAISDEHIRMIAIEEVEEQMAAHHNSYDHDEYDRLIGDLDDKINDAVNDLDISDKINEAINDFDFEDKINDALRSATVTISV